ncbi:hypothetical protein [Burkholderia alba]|uniref:hypothetical protein n=1 Tax=Burkholderia alba TaxID=2683677 RepID=UPI002B057CE7|nr:hypothetical protein [Burkholderia alba]
MALHAGRPGGRFCLTGNVERGSDVVMFDSGSNAVNPAESVTDAYGASSRLPAATFDSARSLPLS